MDADRIELGLHRRHHHRHLLDHRRGLRRRRPVHGLLRVPLPPSARASGGLRAGEQEAGMVAHHRHRARRRGDAGARPLRLEPVRHRPARRDRDRGRRPAMAVELPPSRPGRAARHHRHPPHQPRQPARPQSARHGRAGRHRDPGRRPAPADRQAGQGAAPLDRRAARFLRARVPREDGHGAGLGDLFLVHPHQDRDLRRALRRALRHRARGDARPRRGGDGGRARGMAEGRRTFAQLASGAR